jgi:hypothetical protein
MAAILSPQLSLRKSSDKKEEAGEAWCCPVRLVRRGGWREFMEGVWWAISAIQNNTHPDISNT